EGTECTGNPDLSIAGFGALFLRSGDTERGTAVLGPEGLEPGYAPQISFIYSPKAGTYQGTCQDADTTNVFDLSLQTGWNVVRIDLGDPDDGSSRQASIRTGSIPTNYRWQVIPSAEAASRVQPSGLW